jgi:hypothetical protein
MLNATLNIETLTARLLPAPKGSMLSLLSGTHAMAEARVQRRLAAILGPVTR